MMKINNNITPQSDKQRMNYHMNEFNKKYDPSIYKTFGNYEFF